MLVKRPRWLMKVCLAQAKLEFGCGRGHHLYRPDHACCWRNAIQSHWLYAGHVCFNALWPAVDHHTSAPAGH